MSGELFIISLGIFPFILVLGYIFERLLWGRDIGPFTIIVNIFAFIGVFFHEMSHFILCILTGVPVDRVSIKLRSEHSGRVSPHGSVLTKRPHQVSFLQAVLTALGPVLIGAWIIYFALQIAFNSLIDPIFRIIAGIIAISILITSTPSRQDFRVMTHGFSHDPQHSLYQLILIITSILFTWGIVVLFNIIFPIEFLYYIIIIMWYITLKYSIIGIQWGVIKVLEYFGKVQYKSGSRQFTRRKYKPKFK
ncbi:MAG: M50 family metallopeptidase [Candidatus Thorarchaeota archaeon]